MKVRSAIASLFLSFIASTAEATCLSKATRSFENENAQQSALDYIQHQSRDKAQIKGEMGRDFTKTMNTLPPRSKILDPGGGFSVYGLELAQEGHQITTVNTQDFYADSLFPLADPAKARAFIDALTLKRNELYPLVGRGIVWHTLHNLAKACGVEIPGSLEVDGRILAIRSDTSREEAARDLALLVHEIQDRVKTLEQRGHFKRVLGFAQERLPEIPSASQTEVIDSYGAYHYSTDRLNLIEQYFRVLQPGRKAHIMTIATSSVEVEGKTMPLEVFLSKFFPETFQTEVTVGTRVLIIKKTGSFDFGRLASILGEPGVDWYRGDNDYSYPNLSFKADLQRGSLAAPGH